MTQSHDPTRILEVGFGFWASKVLLTAVELNVFTALSDRQRSLNNLCILAALNRPHEFKVHFRGALRNGCTLDELRDTLVQIAVYCGIPAGVEAFRLAREVLADAGVDVPPRPGDDPATAADVGMRA